MKPHKHAAIIKAWVDGKLIQQAYPEGNWVDCPDNNPQWDNPAYIFRVKPEPKPNIYKHARFICMPKAGLVMLDESMNSDNVKFTFDGETNELISVEKI